MIVVKPYQLSVQSQVIELDNRFYFIVSATLGSHLTTGEIMLEPDWRKEAMEGMGDNPFPDPGMPKPSGEYIISGNYFSANGTAVTGGEIKVKVGSQQKQLLVFGPRRWESGFPTTPEPVSSVALSFTNAFGGKEFINNPDGIGFRDELLPFIESPDQLIDSPNSQPDPAGLSVINPGWPQRMQFEGTYDDQYLQKYFPGRPADFDWRYFHCAPQDQWHTDYYRGDESYEIVNMHPEQSRLSGKLPGLYARCFINREDPEEQLSFSELDMKLDTIWLFPEQELVLQTWRSTIEVRDDEAKEMKHVLLAYERRSDPKRSLEHYKVALQLRLNNEDDTFLNNFKTRDLIPEGDKTAMALLFENAFSDESEESELSRNLAAKTDAVQKKVDEQLNDTKKQFNDSIPVSDALKKENLPDLNELLSKKGDVKPDADVDLFTKRLNEILPGITSGDPKKIDFSDFSFAKIDEIMKELEKLMNKKQIVVGEQVSTIKKQLNEQMGSLSENLGDVPDQDKVKLEEMLNRLDSIGRDDKKAKHPLPRMVADEIITSMSQIGPQTMDAMAQLQSLKSMGIDSEHTQNLEKLLGESMGSQNQKMAEQLKAAEKDFRNIYLMSAHFMDEGTHQHKADVDVVRQQFLDSKQNVAEKDWACIDLSNQNLDGIDLSGCYLEQVNFTGTSLVGANFSGSILARAILDGANLTAANFKGANVGAVHAHQANFTDSDLTAAKLSKGDFTGADFTRAKIVDVESLEIVVDSANFTETEMPEMKFIEANMSKVNFSKANLSTVAFLNSRVHDCNFSGATIARGTWADTKLTSCVFDYADMTGNCFVTTEEEFLLMENIRFVGANLEKCNFQNMSIIQGDFTDAKMESAIFNNADLSKANFTNAFAKGAQFRGAKLTRAKMDNIFLMEGSLAKAHLVGASFTGANLYAVDVLRSTVGETDFRGANLECTLIKDWRPA